MKDKLRKFVLNSLIEDKGEGYVIDYSSKEIHVITYANNPPRRIDHFKVPFSEDKIKEIKEKYPTWGFF